jgi:murein DD-endopeptidase MepM/ murein hydrolase activator NlpD
MIAAMISISMLTTVIENLDKGGQGDFAGSGTTATPGSIATGTATPADTVKPQTPFETPKVPKSIPGAPIPGPGGIDLRASNFQTPTTTYATGPMGDGTPNGTYASWYRNTYLQQSPPPQNTGFDTFGERALSGASLGGITLKNPFLGGKSNPVTSPFGLCPGHSNPIHAGLDLGCAMGDPLTPMAPCQVIYAGPAGGYGFVFDCRIMNGSTPSNVVFSYGHLDINPRMTQGMIVNPGQVIGTCNTHGFSTGPHLHLEIVVDSPDIPKLYPGNGALFCHNVRPVGHVAAASSQFGRNAYYVNPEPLLAGAMSLQGVEAAGFSAVATNFKNFGILDVGFLLVVVICIVSLQILKQAQRFTSGQGMGVFMKALGQMITGVIQTLGAMVGVGAKAAEMAAPVAGWAGGMAAGAAGQILQSTGLDKAVNRAAEGVQGAMNNVTQGLSGVMDNIGSGISGFVQQSVQAVQTLPITQRAMEFQQGMRDLAAGIASSDFAQGIARVVMPGVAVLTFATKNIAMPVAGFVGREMLLPAAGAAVQQGAAFAFNTLTNNMLEDVNFAGELQNARENLAKAPLSEAPARDAATRATPAVEQQQGGWVPVENTNPQNDYAVLGVREGATLEEMRAALRQKGRELHPDINPNGGDQFREVTAAFGRLKSRGDVQAATPQEITPETTRALSGTTVAPIPRGETEDSRAAEESSRRDSVAASREALGDYGGGGSYESRFREEDQEADHEPTTNESSSHTKPKTEGPANNIVSARGLRDNNKKPDLRQEGMKRAASVAGDGVSAHEIIAMVGYDADEGAMRKAKADIISKRTMQISRK